MADRLQKTLDVQPTVASLGNPAPQSNTLAKGITEAGALAGDVIVTRRKGELEEDLRGLGEEVFAAKEGKDLEEATERFTRLKKAKDQGILSDSMVNIEAEKVLKQKIGINSAFAPQLRQEAARILGFDPSGSEIQALFGKGGKSTPARPLTQAEKEMNEATTIATTLDLNTNDVFAQMQKAKLGKIMVDNQTSLAQIGQSNANGILSASLSNIDSDVADAVGEVMNMIQQGGIVNPEVMQGQFQQAKRRAWVAFRGALTESKIVPSATDIAGHRKEFDAEWAPLIDLAASGTVEAILTRQKNSLTAASSIQGTQMFPGLAVINSALGQAGVQEYLKLSDTFQDENQLDLFARMSPSFAAIKNNRPEAFKAMTNSYNRVMGITPITTDADLGLDDGVSRTLVDTSTEPSLRGKILSFMQARGHSFKDFGDYAQPGVRAKATKEEVLHVQTRWGVEFEPLVSRIASSLKSELADFSVIQREELVEARTTRKGGKRTVGQLVTQEGGAFLEVKGQRVSAARRGRLPSTRQLSSGLETDIKRLNAMGRLVRNGWATDVGEQPFGFLERTVNKIGALQGDTEVKNEKDNVGDAISAFKTSPSPENLEALRAVAPDIVAEAERRAAERGVQTNEQ